MVGYLVLNHSLNLGLDFRITPAGLFNRSLKDAYLVRQDQAIVDAADKDSEG